MTGYGQDGPLAGHAGHDINYIALTGALHGIGTAESPVPPLNLVGDYGGGGMLRWALSGIAGRPLASGRSSTSCSTAPRLRAVLRPVRRKVAGRTAGTPTCSRRRHYYRTYQTAAEALCGRGDGATVHGACGSRRRSAGDTPGLTGHGDTMAAVPGEDPSRMVAELVTAQSCAPVLGRRGAEPSAHAHGHVRHRRRRRHPPQFLHRRTRRRRPRSPATTPSRSTSSISSAELAGGGRPSEPPADRRTRALGVQVRPLSHRERASRPISRVRIECATGWSMTSSISKCMATFIAAGLGTDAPPSRGTRAPVPPGPRSRPARAHG